MLLNDYHSKLLASITIYSFFFSKIHSPNYFQIYNIMLLTISYRALHYIPRFIHFLTRNEYLVTSFTHFVTRPQPQASSSLFPLSMDSFCVYMFCLFVCFLDSSYKWDHMIFIILFWVI